MITTWFYYMLCQTTNSGSNNKTMVQELHQHFLAEPGNYLYWWNPDTMHIFCFCHKLALIVNAGLAALGVKAPPPRKVKETDHGHLPVIGTIAEEDEEAENEDVPKVDPPRHSQSGQDPSNTNKTIAEHDLQELETKDPVPQPEVIADLDNKGEWDVADTEEEECPQLVLENEIQPTHHWEANNFNHILQKVLFISYTCYW